MEKDSVDKNRMGCYWIGLAPIAYCAITVIGYATLLCVSWANCHLEEYKFPKISHIGAKQPELQFFAFVCMLQAICFALTTHYAYQVWRIVLLESRLLKATYYSGMFSVTGLILIGCFQVDQASDLHFSGAVICFILGGCYFIMTTIVTRFLRQKDKYFDKIYRYRCAITVLVAICMFIMILTMSIKQYIFNKDKPDFEEKTMSIVGCQFNITFIKMSDHYYSWELYSSLTEWVSCVVYLFYFYSYRHELKMISTSTTLIGIKDRYELAKLVHNNRMKNYSRAGWAPLDRGCSGEDDDENAESGSLLENESFEALS